MGSNFNRIPITIITGFLGSGKTTLINSILREFPDFRFAIIENEFGSISIDSSLIESYEDGIYELSNGCICCTINDELEETMFQMLDDGRDFDHVIIETTGVADPNKVAATLLNDNCKEAFEINSCICLIDIMNYHSTISKEDIALRQIAFADKICISKGDSDESLESLIRSLNRDCLILNSNTDIDKSILEKSGSMLEISEYNSIDVNGYDTFTLEYDIPFERDLFRYAMNMILNKYEDEILRIKGIISFDDSNDKFIFQSVRFYGDLKELAGKDVKQDEKSYLVFIHKGINLGFVENQLQKSLSQIDQ